MVFKRSAAKKEEAPAVDQPTKATKKVKSAAPAMSLDQQMVHAALNAGVEA